MGLGFQAGSGLVYLHRMARLSYLILNRIGKGLIVARGKLLMSSAVVEVLVLAEVELVLEDVLDVEVVIDWVVDVEALVELVE